MASVKFSVAVSDLRGSAGGATFQGNTSGTILRARRKPTNKNTSKRIYQNSNLAVYSQKWSNLSEADRQSWIDNAALYPYQNRVGETKIYTGFAWFMKVNLTLEAATAI